MVPLGPSPIQPPPRVMHPSLAQPLSPLVVPVVMAVMEETLIYQSMNYQ